MIFLIQAFSFAENLCPLAKNRAGDETHVYLATIAGTSAPWSTFSHSTLWLSNGLQDTDESYNWGTFNPNQPNLLASFLNGTMTYWLNVEPYTRDRHRFTRLEDRTMKVQRLYLPPTAIEHLKELLEEERKPENKAFAYDWATQSCATKIRDRLNTVLNNQLYEQLQNPSKRSMRQEGLRYLHHVPYLWFLWDRSISYDADQKTTQWNTMFSPYMLSQSLDQIDVLWPDGKKRKLVPYSCTYDRKWAFPPENPPDHRLNLLCIGLFSSGVAAALRLNNRAIRTFSFVYLFLFSSVLGLVGVGHALLWFSALSSLHPNGNSLISGPQVLFWIPMSWFLYKKTQCPNALKWAVTISSICAIAYAFFELFFGLQDNDAQLALFIPIHITALWLLRKNSTPYR
ncbi:MAG: hypothetical protein CMK59_10910 [Proteobacteria bacterium]|nr:hypothetical protein [Pseudomonadota bacterium]